MPEPLIMKLLIDTKSCRVLFAEANEDVVDFIFGLLALPLGSIVKLLSEEQMVGSMGNVYRSVKNLRTTEIQSNFDKAILLSPKIPSSSSFRQQSTLLLADTAASANTSYSCCGRYTDVRGTYCPNCKCKMTQALQHVDPISGKVGERGCAKGIVRYTVMDDLSVSPMSSISRITVIRKLNVNHVRVLKEKYVPVGMQEALELLKASLQSKTVLTDVFFDKDY